MTTSVGAQGKKGATPTIAEWTVERVAPDRIAKSPTNPRKTFPAAAQEELLESVRAQGIINPLIVRKMPEFEVQGPDLVEKSWRVLKDGKLVERFEEKLLQNADKAENAARALFKKLAGFEAVGRGGALKKPSGLPDYELVAGERRWRAALKLNLATVPVIVRALNDDEVEELQIIENLQREDVSALEEAEQYRKMIDSGRYTAETLAGKIGKSRSHVFGRLKLCKLSPKVREAVEGGKLEASTAGLIATVADPKAQQELLELATEGEWKGDRPLSFRDLQEEVKSRQKNLSAATWKWDDCALATTAGPCTTCPKRGGNIPGWEGSPNVCTDVPCFERKAELHWARMVEEHAARGVRLLNRKHTENWFNRAGEPWDHADTVVDPKGKVPGDKKKRTWAELFAAPKGEKEIRTIDYLVHCYDSEGRHRDWISKRAAMARAVDLGIVKKEPERPKSISYEEQQKQRKEKIKPYEAAAPKATELVVAAIEKAGPTAGLIRAILEDRGDSYHIKAALKACGYGSLERLSAGQLLAVWAMRSMHSTVVSEYAGGWNSDFERLAKVLKVNLEKPLEEAKAALKADGNAKDAKASKGKGKK